MLWTLILKDIRIMYRSKVYSIFEILIVMLLFGGLGYLTKYVKEIQTDLQQKEGEDVDMNFKLRTPYGLHVCTDLIDNKHCDGYGVVFEDSWITEANLSRIISEGNNRTELFINEEDEKRMEKKLYIGISSDVANSSIIDWSVEKNDKVRFDVTLSLKHNSYTEIPWTGFSLMGIKSNLHQEAKMAGSIKMTSPSAFSNESDSTHIYKLTHELHKTRIGESVLQCVQVFIILVVINITRTIVQEKATFRTYLVSMGLPIHTYYLAHFLFNLVKCLVIFTPGLVCYAIACRSKYTAFYLCFTILLFLLPTISFAFMVASWFKTQKSAIIFCLVFWCFLIFAPSHMFDDFDKLNSYAYVLPTTLIFTFNMFYIGRTLEVMEQLDQFSPWSASDRALPLYAFWILLILNTIIMFALAIMTDRFVGSWTPWGWWKKRRTLARRLAEEELTTNPAAADSHVLIEQDTSVRRKLESDIDICDVVKIYEETGEMAVKGLKMRAIRGQVAVLLGHNGCGKSTTFSMISGMIKPTQGTIQVAGLDVVSNLTEARQKIGLCPQYNPLIDKLTVWEHLKIVHKLKKAQSDFKTEAIELLESIELLDAKNKLSKNLSGGMKRKLCMLMALIGESSVVLLDEPTAGMDSTARVDVQTMLRKCKHNRTILLTTHNMDEADKLADWVYVMSDGKIQASGSSQFLKSKFGGGWLVTVVVEEPEKYKNVLLELCQKFEAASKIKDVRGQMIEFSIPSENKSKVIQLLQCFENISEKNFDSELLKDFAGKIQNIKITSIGVSLNSLEQVFINVIEQCEKDAKKERNEDEKRETLRRVIETKTEDKIKFGIFSQFIGLSMKRLIYLRRNWITNLLNLVIPIALMCWLLSGSSEEQFGERHSVRLDVNSIPRESIVIVYTDSIDGSKWITNFFAKNSGLIIREISTNRKLMDILREEQFFRRISVVVRAEDQGKKVKEIYVHEELSLAEAIGSFLNVNLEKEPAGQLEYHFHWFLYGDLVGALSLSTLWYLILFAILVTYNSSQCGFLHVEERVSKFKRQQFLTEMSPFIYWFSMYFWEFVIFAVQTSVLLSLFAIYGHIWGWTIVRLLLVCLLAWTAIAPIIFIFSFVVDSTTKITIFVLVFIFLLPAMKFILDLLLNISVKWLPKCRYLFPFQPFVTLLFWIFYLGDPKNLPHVAIITKFLLFTGKMDSDVLKSDCINLALSSLIFNSLLFIFSSRLIRQLANDVLHFGHKSKPPCALTMEPCPVVQQEKEDIQNQIVNPENSTVIMANLVKRFGSYQAVNGLFLGVRNGECFGLLGVNGAGKTTTIEILTREKLACSGEAMIDGKNVRNSVKLGFCPQFDAILPDLTGREVLEILARLQNYKNPSSMVEDLIDCVGMRGNTGKRMKFCSGGQKRKISMACAILSRGKLCILDEPTAGVDPKARRDLWDIVGGIRDGNCGGGVCGSAETTGTATGTTATSGTRTKSVSKEGSEQYSSFLLTSHSMEECEALCTRIGILRKGDMIALGSCQELKSTYGNTFTLTICLKLSEVSQNEKKKEIVREVKEKFAANLLTDENDDVATDLVFEIPRSKSDKWSTKMAEVKKLADEMEIKDYYLVQSSLEDVFIKMNSQSIEKKGPENIV